MTDYFKMQDQGHVGLGLAYVVLILVLQSHIFIGLGLDFFAKPKPVSLITN